VGFDLGYGRHTEMPETSLWFVLYWQALRPLDEDYRIGLWLLDEERRPIGAMNLEERFGVQSWYPTSRWGQDEVVALRVTNMPWWTAQYDRYRVAVGVVSGDDPWNGDIRLEPSVVEGGLLLPYVDNRTLVELMGFRTDVGGMPQRQEPWSLERLPRGATVQEAKWTNGVQILGYTLSAQRLDRGDRLEVALYWTTDRPIVTDDKVFVHLIGEEAGWLTGHDSRPDLEGLPFKRWQVGQVVEDRHLLDVPPEVAAGDAWLAVGIYDPATSERVGMEGGGDFLRLSSGVTLR
jgi:hypothetical protein